MPNFFYFDRTNQKQCPVNAEQLKELATRGGIDPNTPMETDGGHKGTAGQIPGLFTNVPIPAAQTVQAPPSSAVNLFCTNCGAAVSEHAVACMSCGAKPVGHKKFCRHCGVALNPEQVVWVKCGAAIDARIKTAGTSTGKPKNRITAALLAFFFGGLGVHWFYLDKKNKAFTYLGMWIGGVVLAVIIIGLIPLIIVGILALIDTIKLLMMDDEDFDMQYNT